MELHPQPSGGLGRSGEHRVRRNLSGDEALQFHWNCRIRRNIRKRGVLLLNGMSTTVCRKTGRNSNGIAEVRRIPDRVAAGSAGFGERMSDVDGGTGCNSIGIEGRKKEMNMGRRRHASRTQTCYGKAAQREACDWKTGRNSNGIGGSGGQEAGFPARAGMKENAQCRHTKNKIKSQAGSPFTGK